VRRSYRREVRRGGGVRRSYRRGVRRGGVIGGKKSKNKSKN